MKQIINNVLYDTDNSEFVTYYYSSNCKRELYKTKTGKFFVVMSDFWDTKTSIEIKEESFVKDVLGKLNIDKYIELFGAPEQA